MSGAFADDDIPPPLYVKRWLKIFMYSVCLLPIALLTLAVLGQFFSPHGSVTVAIVVGTPTIIAFIWLFIRLYSLCSITVDANGVGQTFALLPGVVEKRVYLHWEQIRRVSFYRLSFHFVGEHEEKLELNTSLFGDMAATIQSVRCFLPKQLAIECNEVKTR